MSEDSQKPEDDISADDWASALAEQETADTGGGDDADWGAAMAEQDAADRAAAATTPSPSDRKSVV